jgi:hypothetical protein
MKARTPQRDHPANMNSSVFSSRCSGGGRFRRPCWQLARRLVGHVAPIDAQSDVLRQRRFRILTKLLHVEVQPPRVEELVAGRPPRRWLGSSGAARFATRRLAQLASARGILATPMTMRAPEATEALLSVYAYAAAIAEYSQTHLRVSRACSRCIGLPCSAGRLLGADSALRTSWCYMGQAFARACYGSSGRERLRLSTDTLEFLLEVLIAKGVQHAEYRELKARERMR